jgi:hypothetical protein
MTLSEPGVLRRSRAATRVQFLVLGVVLGVVALACALLAWGAGAAALSPTTP